MENITATDGVVSPLRALVAADGDARGERGGRFSIGGPAGTARVPVETGQLAEVVQLADRRRHAARGRRIDPPELQARNLLMQILQEREPSLENHVRSVSRMAGALGLAAGLQGEELNQVVRCAELHDIGKVAIPDAIIDHPGPLGEEEWALIRQHTVIGERILSVTPALRQVARLVRSSHERWDGDGYPDKIAGEQIPIGSRITLICDAFDAMTSERPYDPPRTPAAAIEELKRNAGTQFDPALVELFCEFVVPTLEPDPDTPVLEMAEPRRVRSMRPATRRGSRPRLPVPQTLSLN